MCFVGKKYNVCVQSRSLERGRKALFYYFASSTNTFYIFRQHSYIQKIIVKFTQENVKTLAILIKFPIGCLHRVPCSASVYHTSLNIRHRLP